MGRLSTYLLRVVVLVVLATTHSSELAAVVRVVFCPTPGVLAHSRRALRPTQARLVLAVFLGLARRLLARMVEIPPVREQTPQALLSVVVVAPVRTSQPMRAPVVAAAATRAERPLQTRERLGKVMRVAELLPLPSRWRAAVVALVLLVGLQEHRTPRPSVAMASSAILTEHCATTVVVVVVSLNLSRPLVLLAVWVVVVTGLASRKPLEAARTASVVVVQVVMTAPMIVTALAVVVMDVSSSAGFLIAGASLETSMSPKVARTPSRRLVTSLFRAR